MLLPIETIAIILVLANYSFSKSPYSAEETILAIFTGIIGCAIFSTGETIALLKRKNLRTASSRLLISICTTANKVIATITAIILLQYTAAEDIYSELFTQLEPSYLLSNITGMIIFIMLTLATWLPWYYIHKRITPGNWTQRSYLLFKFRYTFFILGLWLPSILLSEYLEKNPALIDNSMIGIYSIIFIAIIAWIFPFFLKKFWGCKNLEDEELRTEIEALALKAGVKVKKICSWKLGGNSIPNAAMVGFLPPFQYLFISNGLLNRLKKDEILGVVGHEIGHLKKRHILFYLLMSISILGSIEPFIYSQLDNHIYAITAIISVFFIYIRFIFAWFSRKFEREADLFSAELLSDHRPLSRGLERIGLLCGNIRNESSWHHFGIAERVLFLRESSQIPQQKQSFKINLIFLKIASLLFFSFLLFNTYLHAKKSILESAPEIPTVATMQQKHLHYQHWLEVSAVLPDETIGPRNLIIYELDKLQNPDISKLQRNIILQRTKALIQIAQTRAQTIAEKKSLSAMLKALQNNIDSK